MYLWGLCMASFSWVRSIGVERLEMQEVREVCEAQARKMQKTQKNARRCYARVCKSALDYS